MPDSLAGSLFELFVLDGENVHDAGVGLVRCSQLFEFFTGSVELFLQLSRPLPDSEFTCRSVSLGADSYVELVFEVCVAVGRDESSSGGFCRE